PSPPGGGSWTTITIFASVGLGVLFAALSGVPFAVFFVDAILVFLGLEPTTANITKLIAGNVQFSKLWSDQPGIMRETTLIPTPVGLNRSQTIRFGQPFVNQRNANPLARLCVAEGFMCGFDLIMPNRPFPAKDAADCPKFFDAAGNPI